MTITNSALSELENTLLSYRRALTSVAAISFVINLLMLSPMIFMMQIMDRVMVSRNLTTLLMLVFIMVGLNILQHVLEFLRLVALTRVGARLDMELNKRVFDAAFDRCMRELGTSPAQALSDLSMIRQTITGPGVLALLDVIWLPIFVFLCFYVSALIGALFFVSAILIGGATWLNERFTTGPMDEAQALMTQSTSFANSHSRNIEVIEAMGMLENIRARWFAIHCRYVNAQSYSTDITSKFASITKFIRITNTSLTLAVGMIGVIEGTLSAGLVMASGMLVGRAMMPLEMLIGSFKMLYMGYDAYQRLNTMLKAYPQRQRKMSLPEPTGLLALENLSAFAPGTKRLILNQITLNIPAGATVAVIGPSASGKSSLARILVGVWSPVSGAIRLDGAELSHWNKDELGKYIGYLPQDVELFDGTIAENISRFGQATAEKIIEAAQRAGMHEAILRFPNGYDTKLGEGGGFLSGGQRQRIGLARALYGDPKIVILDEPNSNLDDNGEQALVEALIDLKRRSRTVVLITHRLSTLSVVDLVMVLADGKVNLYGPRDQVIAALSRKPLPADSGAAAASNNPEPV